MNSFKTQLFQHHHLSLHLNPRDWLLPSGTDVCPGLCSVVVRVVVGGVVCSVEGLVVRVVVGGLVVVDVVVVERVVEVVGFGVVTAVVVVVVVELDFVAIIVTVGR